MKPMPGVRSKRATVAPNAPTTTSTTASTVVSSSSTSTTLLPRSHPHNPFSFAATLLVPDDVPEADLEDAWAVALKRRGVYNLFAVPLRLERLLTLGQFICLDEFLTNFTYLPLRVALLILRTLARFLLSPFGLLRSRYPQRGDKAPIAAVIDCLHISILLITAFALWAVDVSWVYHNVRGQSVIKLYVVFNVVEIFDRLCSSFGVDILDSLGWTTASAVAFFARETNTNSASRSQLVRARALQGLALVTRMAFDYFFTLAYSIIHAALLLTWVMTLNVAINTQNNALLTLLVSNNFVELKGAVFKNFKIQNLFQIACADSVERFQLTVFLAIMLVVTRGDERLFKTWGVIYACEIIVDWIKHAFVTKFNRIKYRIYHQFSLVICDDMVKTRKNSVVRGIGGSAISKRIGFVSLPLAALVIRMAFEPAMTLPTPALLLVFLSLVMFKTALSIGLLGHAHRRVKSVAESSSMNVGDGEDREQDIYWHQKLINVERYDIISKS